MFKSQLAFVFFASFTIAPSVWAADAGITMGSAIKSQEVSAWGTARTNSVECRALSDVPATYLCLTDGEVALRDLFGRVSYFVEGHAGRVVVPESDETYRNSEQAQYAGHDIMAPDFNEFFKKMDEGCKTNQTLCANKLETELRAKVIGDAKKKNYKNYVVIAAATNTDYMSSVISHEVLHARFFLNKKFQNVVEAYWNKQLSAEERQQITAVMGEIYNLKGENGKLLLLNEFQAYVLQEDAMYDQLGQIAMYHGHALRTALEEKGLLPKLEENLEE